MKILIQAHWILLVFFASGCSHSINYDILITNGLIIDGSGKTSFTGDIGINSDTIAAIGNLDNATGETEIDATGLVVAPGFINMLSWATLSLIEDGRSLSDLKQGVTLEVFGEGWSMGPLNEQMKEQFQLSQRDIKFNVEWTSLVEYLDFLVKRGISTNIASFLGATTLRYYAIGLEDRAPSKEELKLMKSLTREAMEDGALGIASSLVYVPALYASTEELIELCKVVAEYDGMYISHLRNESYGILEGVNELIRISKEANIRAEIYHLKIAGSDNWGKFNDVISKIDSARSSGLGITANMYTYTAGATLLSATLPPWVKEGGTNKWFERLKDPSIRKKLIHEMHEPSDKWENLFSLVDSADKIILISFKNDSLKYLSGKSLAEVAKMRNQSPESTAMDLVIQDNNGVGAIYFMMSEENIKRQLTLPWISFGSDAESLSPEGVFLNSSTHPRAYGNFARLLGRYVRDEKIIQLEDAIYKLTTLPATNLKIKKRGAIKTGNFADIVLFNPDEIQDHATYENPMQFSTGMIHVFVNGVQVINESIHTGKLPGRVVHGPGANNAYSK